MAVRTSRLGNGANHSPKQRQHALSLRQFTKTTTITMTSNEPVITSYQLRGHRSSVLCLDVSSSMKGMTAMDLLLSGSEDKTARLWDLRTAKTSLCMMAPDEVTSVAFSPIAPSSQKNVNDEVKSSRFAKDFSVFLSAGNSVMEYDLRKATLPILRVDDSLNNGKLLESNDEMNQISFNPKGTTMAIADDGGFVRILMMDPVSHSQQQRQYRDVILRHYNTSDSLPPLVTSCCFRNNAYLASGDTDCNLYYWDVAKPKKPLCQVSLTAAAEYNDTAASTPQVCNPPMIHSLEWSPSGRLLAAGLGDGSIAILGNDTSKKKKQQPLIVQTRLEEDGHSSSIASLTFAQFFAPPSTKSKKSSQSLQQQRADRLLVSAGTDGNILFWDLGSATGGEHALDPAEILNSMLVESFSSNTDQAKSPPLLLFGVPHPHKPNWITSNHYDSIFVADTSNEITAYKIPLYRRQE